MMEYQPRLPGLSNVRATHYTSGADHLYYMDSAQGYLWWLPLNPTTMLVAKTEKLTLGKRLNLNTFTGVDVQWNSTGTALAAMSFARIQPIPGVSSLEEISPSSLVEADWNAYSNNNTVPEDGTSGTGRFYAVRIPYGSEFHYAKLRVYQNAGQTWIEWVTYSISPNPYRLSTGFTDVRDIVISESETALYLTAQYYLDGNHYVVYSPRSTLGSPYPDFSSQAQPVHDTPLDEPQQLALDGGFIYVADATTLWRIDLSARTQVPLVQGLVGGTGLLLSNSGTTLKAYLSDGQGNVFAVDLSEGSESTPLPPPTWSLNTSSGLLSWANAEHSAIYIALRDKREVARIDLLTGDVTTEGKTSPTTPGPWSVEVLSDSKLLVACESELGQFTRTIEVSGNLLLGIGLIPFGYINNSEQPPAVPGPNDGRVNTSSAPGYYFSTHPNLPLGGTLSLMLNHELAWSNGIRFYSVKLKNLGSSQTRSILDPFTDFKWNASAQPPKFMSEDTSSISGLYPIRSPADLWYNPYLAAKLKTSSTDNGHNLLTVEFYDANKQPVTNGSHTRLLLIDNTRCNAKLELPRVGTDQTPPAAGSYPALTCGCLAYTTKDDLVELDFKAWQPQGSGTYNLRVSRGGVGLSALAQNGNVTVDPTLFTKNQVASTKPIRIGHILGDCDVANVVITLNGPSRVIDGFGWVNLGAYDSKSFTLIKGPVGHTPWTEP